MPAFDFELRQRMRERRACGSSFFFVEFFRQARFGASAGFFGFGFVDVLRADRHVGQDRDAVAGDFHKAFADGQENRFQPFCAMISPATICVISGTCCGKMPISPSVPGSVTMSTSSE